MSFADMPSIHDLQYNQPNNRQFNNFHDDVDFEEPKDEDEKMFKDI